MLIDKILQADVKSLSAMPTGEIEIKRLSEKIGEPFKMQLKGIKLKKYRDLIDFHSEEVEIEEYNEQKKKWQKVKERRVRDEMSMLFDVIIEGTVDPNFRDTRLQEKFHEPEPPKIVESLFTAGELNDIAAKITELSDIEMNQAQVDAEIKN